jgi:predicted dehydrogenase
VDEGAIGEPVAAVAFMTSHGPDRFHPNADIFFQAGAGPLFDFGPYYLTALVAMLGPVRAVAASTKISFPERSINKGPRAGQAFKVEVPTHVVAALEFESGALGNMIMSFDVWAANLPRIEVYGTEGSLSVPDPNRFGGPVRVRRSDESEWREVPIEMPYAENSRGVGLADMAQAISSGRPHRAGGEIAYHVLDVMETIYDAARERRHVELGSTCERPAPFPKGLGEWQIDG